MEQVFKKYYQELKYYAYRFLKVWQDAEDVAIDCIIHVCQNEKYCNNDLHSILLVSVKNKCLDILAKRHVRKKYIDQISIEFENEINIELFQIEVECLKKIKQIINKLPIAEREVFELHFYENKKCYEIAHELQKPTDTIRLLKRHAINAVKKYLSKSRLYNEIKN